MLGFSNLPSGNRRVPSAHSSLAEGYPEGHRTIRGGVLLESCLRWSGKALGRREPGWAAGGGSLGGRTHWKSSVSRAGVAASPASIPTTILANIEMSSQEIDGKR